MVIKNKPSKKTLERMYLEEGMSTYEIGEKIIKMLESKEK